MQQDLNNNITYLIGDEEIINAMEDLAPLEPFSDKIILFLNDVSRILLESSETKRMYPDVVTLGFWIRKASMLKMKADFVKEDGYYQLGRGTVFHIAPSNVAVNFAYSLVAGIVCGNANIVRVPSKDFPQIDIIKNAFEAAIKEHPVFQNYICLIRYPADKTVNDWLSSLCDVRVIWGGDGTIAELRKSPLRVRAGEVTFADRYSIAVIDSDEYIKIEHKERTAEDFYNDTYLTDQNACTSPKIVVWIGSVIDKAKEQFWTELHKVVKKKYQFQSIQGINKLTDSFLTSVHVPGCKIEPHEDNLIIRTKLNYLPDEITEYFDHSGFFLEYDCQDLMELKPLCSNKCQTIGYIGNSEMIYQLLRSGIKGVDRIVPVGRTMDFELIWDGYNLFERLTRVVRIR